MWSIIVRKLTGRVKPQRERKAPSNRLDVGLKYGTLVVFQILELQMKKIPVFSDKASAFLPETAEICYTILRSSKGDVSCQQ